MKFKNLIISIILGVILIIPTKVTTYASTDNFIKLESLANGLKWLPAHKQLMVSTPNGNFLLDTNDNKDAIIKNGQTYVSRHWASKYMTFLDNSIALNIVDKIKRNHFNHIYNLSSENLKNLYSEDEFTKPLNDAFANDYIISAKVIASNIYDNISKYILDLTTKKGRLYTLFLDFNKDYKIDKLELKFGDKSFIANYDAIRIDEFKDNIVNLIKENKLSDIYNLFYDTYKNNEDEKTFIANLQMSLNTNKITSSEVLKRTQVNDIVTKFTIKMQTQSHLPLTLSLSIGNYKTSDKLEIASLSIIPDFKSYFKTLKLPNDVIEENLVVTNNYYTLPAKLTMPKDGNNFPVVILINDYNLGDKDGTILGLQFFRDIAYYLAQNGIASFRYDNRAYVYKNKDFTYNDIIINDALEAINVAKYNPKINKKNVFVLGNGIGGFSIPKIASKANGVKGYIMMSAPAGAITDVLTDRIMYPLINLKDKYKSKNLDDLNDYLANLKKVLQDNATKFKLQNPNEKLENQNIFGINDNLVVELLKYNVLNYVSKINEPLLIVQGGKDFGVTMKDFNIYENTLANKHNVIFKDYPNLDNHFVFCKGKGLSGQYFGITNLDTNFLNDLCKFIKSNI